MSQYGMQMPGGRSSRGPSLGLIDGLLALSIIAMGFAIFFMYQAAEQVSPGGKVWETHGDGPIVLPE
ncbi:MAG: hypothetical protein RIE77_13485 [Phycisphaerales bacterium]|jgi:hypothetical protein